MADVGKWIAAGALAVGAAWLGAACSSDDGGTAAPSSPGAKIYATNCVSCHGAQGQGGQGPAIGDGKAAAHLSESEMHAIVSEGKGIMPAFSKSLTDTEIDQVVDYVRDDLGRGDEDAGPTTTAPRGDRGSLKGVPPELDDATGDWPLANGDYASTRTVAKPEITSENVDDLEVEWSTVVKGGGQFGNLTTTPVVSGDSVYVGALDTKVHAIDRDTGEERWVGGKDTGIFGPTGVGIGWGQVYGTTQNDKGNGSVLVAYDAKTGKQRWATDLGANGGAINMQPTAYDGLVFASTAGYGGGTRATIYAVAAESGKVVWDFEVIEDDDLWGNPKLNSGGGVWYPPAIDPQRRVVYFGTGNPYPFPGAKGYPNGESRPGDNKWTDSMLALELDTGKLVWGFQAIPHDIFDRDSMITALTDAKIDGKDTPLAISTGKLGIVTALDASTGKVVWRTEVGTHENDELTEIDGPTLVYPGSLGGVQTPVAIDDGTIYACVMNAPTQYAGPEETSFGFTVKLGTDDSQMVAIDAATGKVRWTHTLDGDSFGGSTISGDLLFTSTFSGTVLALDRETGDEVWSWKAPGGINGWPAIAGDELYVPVGVGPEPTLVKLSLPD